MTPANGRGIISSTQTGFRKGDGVSRESYLTTVAGWRQFLQSLDKDLARSEAMERQVALLATLYVRAEKLVQERDALRASMQTATRELQETLRAGRTALDYLRTAVRVQVPPKSPKLRTLGIKMGGRPSRRKKASAPRE